MCNLRSNIWLTGIAILVGISAGCNSLERVDPSGQVITFWYQHSGEREEILQDMIAEFNMTNEWGITVVGEHVGYYSEIYNKIIEGIPTGQIPELTVAYQNQAAMYVKLDSVIEVTPYIESATWGFSEVELEDFFPFVMLGDYLFEYDGRYGFPTQRSMEVLYYNEDWLNRLGYDQPPKTWAEFEEMACKATDQEADTVGYILSVDASTFADMLFNHGGSMINADGNGFGFGNKAGLEVVTFLQDLAKKECVMLESDEHEDRIEFSQEKTLFTISSTAGMPEYRRDISSGANFKWSVSTLPTTLESPRVNVYGASLSILRTTPEKQLAAWLFIKWLNAPAQTANWARMTNYFPVRRSAADLLKDYFVENPEYAKAFSYLEYEIAIEPGMGSYEECRGSITEMFEAAVLGGDPPTILQEAVDECDNFWSELKEE